MPYGVGLEETNLVCNDFPCHFPEEIGSTTSPPMLLMSVGLEGTWKFTLNLYKICNCNADMEQHIIASAKSNYLKFAETRPNTLISPTYRNSHPLRLARTAKSMSSTVVRSFHPPDWLIADTRHTPAVPANRRQLLLFFNQFIPLHPVTWNRQSQEEKKIKTSVYSYEPALTIEAKERVHKWSWFLLNFEMIV